jgi:tetratricopeptide (TPR) repeat protein
MDHSRDNSTTVQKNSDTTRDQNERQVVTAVGGSTIQNVSQAIYKLVVSPWGLVAVAASLVIGLISAAVILKMNQPAPTVTPSPTFTPLPFPPAGKDETLVLIATFHRTEGVVDTDIHNEIRQAIENKAAKLGFSNLRVEVEPRQLRAEERKEAELLGKLYRASIVIWGVDTGVRTTVSFLNLKEPEFHAAEVAISETKRTQLANPDTYAEFVTDDLPSQLTFLSLFAIGQSYYIGENYEGAVAVVEEAVNSLPSDVSLPEGAAEAYFRLGWLYQGHVGNDEQAIAAYSKAIILDPQMVTAYSNRALAYIVQSLSDFTQGDLNAALVDLDKVIELAPDIARAYDNRGMVRLSLVVAQTIGTQVVFDSKTLDAAVADFSKAIELDPEYINSYINRGLVYYFRGDSYAAIADFAKVIELDPQRADVYHKRGNVYLSLGEPDMAIADFNTAIELEPDNVAIYYDQGLAHFEEGNLDAALADFDSGIKLESELAASHDDKKRGLSGPDEVTFEFSVYFAFAELTLDEAYYRRGTILGMKGKLNEAIADFNEAIELNPEYTDVYYNRGAARYTLGKLVSALADFDKAIELDPHYVDAYRGRGVVQRRLNNLDAALADFRIYLELQPDADDRETIGEWIAELEAELSNQ